MLSCVFCACARSSCPALSSSRSLTPLSRARAEKGGVTIFSHKRIAMHYLRGWFLIDLIACLPWEEMAGVVSSGAAGSVFVKILKSCKALRLLRLSRLFKFLERQQLMGHVMRMVRMLFFFFLFAHWVACLWYALGAYYFTRSEGVDGWLPACAPPLDPNTSPFSDLYVTSLYWVLTTWVTVVRWMETAAGEGDGEGFAACAMRGRSRGTVVRCLCVCYVLAVVSPGLRRRSSPQRFGKVFRHVCDDCRRGGVRHDLR